MDFLKNATKRSRTRGHKFKQRKQKCQKNIGKFSFANNSRHLDKFSENVVDAKTVSSFKASYDKVQYWEDWKLHAQLSFYNYI